MSAVVPSCEIIPASGGIVVGSTTDTTFGPLCSSVTSAFSPAGSSEIGVAWR